ncbi:MAG TPA: hypothetical protein VLC08_15625 [Chitinolyticbacter sp.]|nr:hypothetical protein [Chitinolyticbacter sp.]
MRDALPLLLMKALSNIASLNALRKSCANKYDGRLKWCVLTVHGARQERMPAAWLQRVCAPA